MPWKDNDAWDEAIEQREDDVVVAGRRFGRSPREGSAVLHRPGQLLIDRAELDRDETGARLREILERAQAQPDDRGEQSRTAEALGLRLLRVTADPDLPALVRRLNDVVSGCASVHHVLVAGPQRHGGDSPPVAAAVPADIPGAGDDGAGVSITVLDTGIADPAPLRARFDAPDDVEPLAEDPPGVLGPAVGHGTFVGGVISRHAPGAELRLSRLLSVPSGLVDELTVAQKLRTVAKSRVLNLSFGGFAVDDRTMLALERAFAALPHETLVVAAAGNHGVSRPFFPAAFKRVLGVAAADQTERGWERASYSNFGPWVDACSVGTDVHSTFVTFPPQGFAGGATWSGTSFAAPRVAAAAAALAARGGIPVRLAAHLLLHSRAHPVVGEVGRLILSSGAI